VDTIPGVRAAVPPVEAQNRTVAPPVSRRTRALRVLLISHTCQSRTEGQPKAELLGRMPEIDLRVLVPDRWREYGTWRAPHRAEGAAFACEVGRVAWPWAGPAQWYLHWYPRLRRTVEEFRPDIIDVWEEPWGLVSAQVCWLRDRCFPGVRIVSETEQNINKRLPIPFERFRSYTLQRAQFAVGRSAEAVGVLRAKGYRGRAAVVPNGVDGALFRPLDREACRRELGLGGFVAGYVGRLVEQKGLMEMMDALAFCPPDVHLLFVGSGPFKTSLESQAQALGKASQVRFLSFRPARELARLMNALDALVLVSRTTPRWKEQFGRVLVEAQACRTPVIGSGSGAIPEVVGEAGLIVPERSPEAVAAAIRTLHSDPQQREELGAIGRCQVEEHYTWERVAARMSDIYSSLA
jgi:glycosyltransferase involved in cell wall biosynthesis